MHGNVSEWTIDQYIADLYTKRNNTPVKDPFLIPTETLYPHSVRGGSYEDEIKDLRSAARRGSDPQWKVIDPQIPKSNWWLTGGTFVGIRLVRPYNKPSKEEIEAYFNLEPIPDF